MLHQNSIQLLVMQATEFCNINCSYCYLPNRSSRRSMSRQVLERVGSQIVASAHMTDKSIVLWHAGEPLSLPLSWYRDAYEILEKSRPGRLNYQFQSNGTLLDTAWIRFLRETSSSIGLSIDGPQSLHDSKRRYRSGRGTFHNVLRAVDTLRDQNIAFTNIATVTSDSFGKEDEIFEFFDKLRPEKLGLSIEEAEGSNMKSTIYQDEFLEKTERFFEKISSNNFGARCPLRIREIEAVLAGLLRRSEDAVNQENQLGPIVSVGVDGAISFFSPELLTTSHVRRGRLIAGNILDESFDAICRSAGLYEVHSEIKAGVEACRKNCECFRFCGGGSPANKLFEHGTFNTTETWQCRLGRQAATRGILKAISKTKSVENRATK